MNQGRPERPREIQTGTSDHQLHAEYQGQHATFTFDGEILAGTFHSPTALRLIREWSAANGVELEANWARGKAGQPLERIAPWTEEKRMDVLPAVICAEYRGAYKIRLVFNDGVEATIDFSDWLTGPVFEPLRDVAYFARFFIEGGTIA